jgi:creatinine amidohydrolase
MAIHHLDRLTRSEVADLSPDTVVILPAAATEQHGPHLALRTDTALVDDVVAGAAARLADRFDIVICPTLVYGASDFNLPFPGTMSLSNETYLAVVKDLTRCLIGHGFRRILIVTGHGGNDPTHQIVARDLMDVYPVQIFAAKYWMFDFDALVDLLPANFGAVPDHAADWETTLLMAASPSDVRPDHGALIRDELARIEQEHGSYVLQGRPDRATPNATGFSNDASHADAALGRRLLDQAAASMAEFVSATFG